MIADIDGGVGFPDLIDGRGVMIKARLVRRPAAGVDQGKQVGSRSRIIESSQRAALIIRHQPGLVGASAKGCQPAPITVVIGGDGIGPAAEPVTVKQVILYRPGGAGVVVSEGVGAAQKEVVVTGQRV